MVWACFEVRLTIHAPKLLDTLVSVVLEVVQVDQKQGQRRQALLAVHYEPLATLLADDAGARGSSRRIPQPRGSSGGTSWPYQKSRNFPQTQVVDELVVGGKTILLGVLTLAREFGMQQYGANHLGGTQFAHGVGTSKAY